MMPIISWSRVSHRHAQKDGNEQNNTSFFFPGSERGLVNRGSSPLRFRGEDCEKGAAAKAAADDKLVVSSQPRFVLWGLSEASQLSSIDRSRLASARRAPPRSPLKGDCPLEANAIS